LRKKGEEDDEGVLKDQGVEGWLRRGEEEEQESGEPIRRGEGE
jgi:hypothetical protein